MKCRSAMMGDKQQIFIWYFLGSLAALLLEKEVVERAPLQEILKARNLEEAA
jgi:hypothetical protein